MNFSEFHQKIRQILDVDLPAGSSLTGDSHKIARNIKIGRTAFMDEMGVGSEREYKTQCVKENKIMFHAHIGLNSWEATADALARVNEACREAGWVVDRAGLCLDRRMGLPEDYRDQSPAETGPLLETDRDWMNVGRAAPIQPHMGDFMIGFPASVENTVSALKAGVTTIGNLSQFFSHEVPGWHDPAATTVATVKAVSIMGALRDQGTLMHSYLEDGFGALFCDCATTAGWACLEKYIVEDLLGAKLAHCIGGLTTDPIKRSGWVFALNEMHDRQCTGSMIYGDTLSFTADFTVNRGLVAEYLLWDIMAQLQCPTGHAVQPLPVTEALRVPSAEEIAEAQIFGRRVAETARRLLPHTDFSAAHDFSKKIVRAGKAIFNDALAGLKQADVDIEDPVQLLYVLKALGPAVFEEMFGAGELDPACARGRKPVIPTDVFELSNACVQKHRDLFARPESRDMLHGRRILIASTDVHEHAIMVIHQLLAEAGAEMINLGAETNPDQVVAAARDNDAEAVLISTHNGMALDYAQLLKEEMAQQGLDVPVVMGGILNQKVADQALPVDVSGSIKKLDFLPCPRLETNFSNLLEYKLGASPHPVESVKVERLERWENKMVD
jgi:methylmalonyl-CoA mutase cobalamin-binding domain/chain